MEPEAGGSTPQRRIEVTVAKHSWGAVEKILNAKFGDGHAVRADGDRSKSRSAVKEVVPTGIGVVDNYLLPIGGLPITRVSEVFGDEGVAKTTFVFNCIASAQQAGAKCVLVDNEHEADLVRARDVFGVNTSDLLLVEPDTLEEGLESMKIVLGKHKPSHGPLVIFWDSIASSLPKATMEREAGQKLPGVRAAIMSEEVPKIVQLAVDHRAHVMALNQNRDKIGVMFGDPKTQPGGKAWRYACSWRAEVSNGESFKDGDAHTGKVVKMLVKKTRFSEPWRKAELRLDFATGFNDPWSTVTYAKARGLYAVTGRTVPSLAKQHAACLEVLKWERKSILANEVAEAEDDEEET